MNTISKTILITGSSKGFGKELAKEFLNKGHNVVICSKSSENIQAVSLELNKYENVLPLVIDVQNYEDYVKEIKPYKSKIREYVSSYQKTEPTNSMTTEVTPKLNSK